MHSTIAFAHIIFQHKYFYLGELNIDSSLTGLHLHEIIEFLIFFILGQLYQIATKPTESTNKTQLQTVIRIDDIPSFVDSKATYETIAGTFADVDWFIVIDLSKYCQDSKRYITLNSTSSDTPEFLGTYFYCESNPNVPHRRYFDIDAIIKFKRTCFSKEFILTLSNQDTRRRNAHPELYCPSSPDRSSEINLFKCGFGTKIEVCLILVS